MLARMVSTWSSAAALSAAERRRADDAVRLQAGGLLERLHGVGHGLVEDFRVEGRGRCRLFRRRRNLDDAGGGVAVGLGRVSRIRHRCGSVRRLGGRRHLQALAQDHDARVLDAELEVLARRDHRRAVAVGGAQLGQLVTQRQEFRTVWDCTKPVPRPDRRPPRSSTGRRPDRRHAACSRSSS